MRFIPRLVASFRVQANAARAPDSPHTTGGPIVQRWPHRRLVVIRADDELLAYDLDRLTAGDGAPAARFPAPWPRRAGGLDAASPTLDMAVFSGQHALHAVEPNGALRWRVRHACWGCWSCHDSYEEYTDSDHEHRCHDDGSCWISADGSTVWAHVRTPLADDADPEKYDEEWLVLDAADGRVLGRASTDTAAAGSEHVPPPDPGQMGLQVGEGQDPMPLLWGRWDGTRLTVTRIGDDDDDRGLTDVSPDGTRFLTVAHLQGELAIHRLPDGAVTHEIAAYDRLPSHPQAPSDIEDEPFWDHHCGFLDEHTVIAGTSESDMEYGQPRHWLIEAQQGKILGQVEYPMPVSGTPTALGDGTWLTCGEDPFQLLLWSLPQ